MSDLYNTIVDHPIILIIAFIIIYSLANRNKRYEASAYYQVTRLPFRSVLHNKGRYGEYLIYQDLKRMESKGAKFLFNVYIPKGNGETTEIDVLMICSKGIFVFESKNYKGWIFGSENQKNWCQTFRSGQKEHFYNPVMQNRSHIKHLQTFLGEQIPMHSIIVFSERSALINVQIKSNDIYVINRRNIFSTVSEICNQIPSDMLDVNSITETYSKLLPFAQVEEAAKAQHIANIHSNLNSITVQPFQSNYAPPAATKTEATESVVTTQTHVVSVASDLVNEIESSVNIVEPKPIEIDSRVPQGLKCPQCGGNLILRTATRGANIGNKFYGCSNYPKCKYIQNFPNTLTTKVE